MVRVETVSWMTLASTSSRFIRQDNYIFEINSIQF